MRVVLYPVPQSAHIAQILTGLVALEHQGAIRICVGSRRHLPKNLRLQHHLWADLDYDGNHRRVCFDMLDSTDAEESIVRAADVYFKRGYVARVHTVYDWQVKTIRPYGLNYGCFAHNHRFRDLWHALDRDDRRRLGVVGSVASRLSDRWQQRHGKHDELVVSAEVPAAERVMFTTRLWSRDQVPAMDPCVLERLNQSRVATVRALRSAFADRFSGGLVDNAAARALAADLVVPEDTSRNAYIARMQRHLVCVTTTGLHGSTGWKFAEYIAASRCIVSEPLVQSPMVPVEDGVHFLSAATPDACVAACERLLSDAALAANMRRANARYYASHLRPDCLLQRCLKAAVGV